MQELLASLGSQEEHYHEEDHHDGDYDESCDENKEFTCLSNSKCIPLNERCDGEAQCSDGSDEQDCSSRSTGIVNFRVYESLKMKFVYNYGGRFEMGSEWCLRWFWGDAGLISSKIQVAF